MEGRVSVLPAQVGHGIRSRRTDVIVVSVWIAIVLLAQCVFSVEVKPLEWFGVCWLLAGILLVRPGLCLPFALLSCCAFMCEIRRPWSWVQPVMMTLLLVRILTEGELRRRYRAVIVVVGLTALAVSFPQNAAELARRLQKYSILEMARQWIAPHSVWEMFPFRQTVDRALLAMVCAGILIRYDYFSSRRIWNGLWACAVISCLAAICAAVLPWQQHHRFLGTTNYASFLGRFFHGPGYNISFFTISIAAGLPWFFVRAARLNRPWLFGTVLLCMPALLWPRVSVNQRAFEIFLVLSVAVLPFWALFAMFRRRARARLARRISGLRVYWRGMLVSGICLALCSAWYLRMGILDPSSEFRRALALRSTMWSGASDSVSSNAAVESATQPAISFVPPKGPDAEVGRDEPGASAAPAVVVPDDRSAAAVERDDEIELSRRDRLERFLSRYDKVRGPMWALGIQAICKRHPLRGAGAGTWARFHRNQPRPYRSYYSHMHNTYLDLAFEYGLVPTAIVFLLCAVGLGRIVFRPRGISRLWLLYFFSVGAMAMGQHLLFAFSTSVLVLPGIIVLCRALGMGRRGSDGSPMT